MEAPIRDKFLEIVKPEHLLVIYDSIRRAFRTVAIEYDGFNLSPENTRISYGHLKLSFIRDNLEKAKLPTGMRIVKTNHPKNGWPQTEIVIEDRVYLTLKGSEDSDSLPDPSDERRENAKTKQLSLDLGLPSQEVQSINGIVTYSVGTARETGFVSVVFPSSNYTHTLCDRVNVLEICLEYEKQKKAESEERLLKQRPKPINPAKENVKLKKKA